ncbi:MAG TPA: hypothetical protein VGM42_10815, partial [Rhodopila sp.]
MIRLVLLMLCALLVGIPTPSRAQKPATPPAGQPTGQPAITADQARAALQVLNDPAKRAAFAATLNAIVKAQPATPTATPPATPPAAAPAKPETTVEGLKIPLAPDSLGAQVLLSASDFVSQLGNRATDAMDTVQSLPLLYGWVVMMATNDTARGLLADVVWRLALALACAAAAEYGLRLAMRRPIRGLEALAPPPHLTDPDEPPEQPEPDEDAVARAEAGEIEAPLPPRRAPSAWNLLKRVPLVIARLLLELVPVLGIVLVGHLIAGSALGGHAGSRLIILAVVDSYAACAAMLCLVRMLLSPGTSRLRLFHLRDTTAAYLMYWSRRLILVAVFGYA